ncbi:hypothetical protein E2C01_004096 [Portunus trituberculatus]|uniref:Uncharacterized protein n=1 Tax=Portunus trituberculatus TaxID=210409 RepID=A0A5B7CPL9_PORTR|nr:hypothetical protein [Portunus trituberculatus]
MVRRAFRGVKMIRDSATWYTVLQWETDGGVRRVLVLHTRRTEEETDEQKVNKGAKESFGFKTKFEAVPVLRLSEELRAAVPPLVLLVPLVQSRVATAA